MNLRLFLILLAVNINLVLFAQPCMMMLTTAVNNAMGGGPNGTINLTVNGGTPPYSFVWSNGQTTQNATMLPPGCYTVVVTDAVGCQASATSCVTNFLGPILYSNSNPVSTFSVVNGGFTPQWVCANQTLQTDGGIMKIYLESGATMITGGGIDTVYAKTGSTITMTGGIHVIYHEPGVTLNMNGGIPTLYPCASLVFDYSQAPANGCAPVPVCNMTASATVSNVLCNGQASGTATVTLSGGTAPYSYVWSPFPGNTQTVNNLTSGTYTVTVTDANGCITTQSFTVTEPAALVGNASVIAPILCTGGTATVSVSATGGTAPYAGIGSFSQSAGTQTYTITDANGCSSITTANITEPTALSITTTSTDELLGNDGTASVTTTGGTAPYSITWQPGGFTTAAISGLTAGLYMVTVTDANGCGVTMEEQVGSQVGLNSLNQETALSVYPNPSETTITVSNSGSTVFDKVGVFTSEGRLVFEFTLEGNESRILDFSSWSPGRYVLKHAAGALPIVKL
jgi:hypothetical protein